METEDLLDIHLSTFNFSSETKFEIPSCNHAVREVRRTCIALVAGQITETRQEGDTSQTQDRSDIRDGGGENHGRASGPRECGSPGDGSSRVGVCCGGLGITGRC